MSTRTPTFLSVGLISLLAACAPEEPMPEAVDLGSAGWLASLPFETQDAFLAAYEDSVLSEDGAPFDRADALWADLTDDELIALFEAAPELVRHSIITGVGEHTGDLDPAAWGEDGTTAYDDDLPTPPYVTATKYFELPIRWCLAETTPDIGSWGTLLAVSSAASAWSSVSRAKLVYTGSCSEAQIVIDFDSSTEADYSPFDGINGILAQATIPYAGGLLEFDEAETWTTAVRSDINQPMDIQTVALHEFGHALGLKHSKDTSAVMYDYYGGSRRTLTADDIAGIQALYGAPLTTCESAWSVAQSASQSAYMAWYYAYYAHTSMPYDPYATTANTYAYYSYWYADAAEASLKTVVYEADMGPALEGYYDSSDASSYAGTAQWYSVYSDYLYANPNSVTSRNYDSYTIYYSGLTSTRALDCWAGR